MLTRYISFADRLNKWVGESISWLATLLVLVVCVNVAMRHLFDNNQIWMDELGRQFYALLFLLGAGYALLYERHVRVDVFYSKFSDKWKAVVNLVGTCLFLIPFCLTMIYTTWPIAWRSLMINEKSMEPGGLPMIYIIKFLMIIGFALLIIQALSLAAKSLQTLLSK